MKGRLEGVFCFRQGRSQGGRGGRPPKSGGSQKYIRGTFVIWGLRRNKY